MSEAANARTTNLEHIVAQREDSVKEIIEKAKVDSKSLRLLVAAGEQDPECNHPILSRDIEYKLSQLIQNGARRKPLAEKVFVLYNRRFVINKVKPYIARAATQGISSEDLIQEGCQGLIRAAQKYDHNKGFRFSSYAGWWIKQAITRYLQDNGDTIRKPIHVDEKISKYEKLRRKGYTHEEACDEMGMKPSKVEAYLDNARPTLSLDYDLKSEDGTLLDQQGHRECGEQAYLRKEEHAYLAYCLSRIPGRRARVLAQRFGMPYNGKKTGPLTLEQIGKSMRLTRERVRQLEKQGLRELRALMLEDRENPDPALILDLYQT